MTVPYSIVQYSGLTFFKSILIRFMWLSKKHVKVVEEVTQLKGRNRRAGRYKKGTMKSSAGWDIFQVFGEGGGWAHSTWFSIGFALMNYSSCKHRFTTYIRAKGN